VKDLENSVVELLNIFFKVFSVMQNIVKTNFQFRVNIKRMLC
jgi:hypothetical protein